MADLFGLSNAISIQKRKRAFDDTDGDDAQPDFKRRPMTSLPIRSPPQFRSLNVHTPPTTSTFSAHSGTLTPVDTSEDECFDRREYENRWPTESSNLNSQAGSRSTATFKVPMDKAMHDVHMGMCSPPRPRVGRARSNDILASPRRRPELLSPPATSIRDRIPTPINSHFDSRLPELPNVPRHSFPPLRTNLSPMIEQESWTGYQSLPSPAEEVDMDAMTTMNQANVSMSGTSFGTNGDAMNDDNVTMTDSDYCEHITQEPGRTARLHMGFLTGCEKCTRKVPGHYSHILWS